MTTTQTTAPIDSGFTPSVEGQAAVQSESIQITNSQPQNNTNKAWYESLPADDLTYLKSKGWDKAGAEPFMFDSYRNLEKLRGVSPDKLLKLPDVADKDGWTKVYDKLGRPESPDKYEYKAPEGQQIDANRLSWFSKTAHELGLNKEQHNTLVNAALSFEGEMSKSMLEQQQQTFTAQTEQLKKEWGNAYEERKLLAEQGLARYLDDNSEEAVKNMQQVMGNAAVLKLFAKIGERMSEHTMPKTDGDRPFGLGPKQAQEKLDILKSQIMSDKSRLDQYVAGKGFDFDEVQRLLRLATNG